MTPRLQRIIYLVSLLLVFPVDSFTQRFQGGVSAGLNVSQVEGDGYAGYNKAGLNAGIFVNTMISEKTGLQLEIRYSAKGSSKQSTVEQPDVYRIELHYVEIPLLVIFPLSSRFTLETGGSGGYLFSHAEEDAGGEIPSFKPFDNWELAIHAGGIYMLTDHWAAWSRLSYSILRIRQHDSESVYRLNRGQYNNVLTFGIHYRF